VEATLERRAAETVDAGYGAETEEGKGRFDDLERAGARIQPAFFGVGGLIHVAVGLAGGTGACLTKRPGLARNA
jgi:hypothetical protein